MAALPILPRAQPEFLATAWKDACLQDVRAFKPGNVAVCAGGHDMEASQFLRSAEVAGPALTSPGAPVGARIEAAITATREAVGCNTNLGIVLLAAPLLRAAESLPPRSAPALLSDRLTGVLASLDLADARAAYRAIRLAEPGGLGSSERHDVHQEPQVSLREAMLAAAPRDGIAREYASGFARIFELGVAVLQQAARQGEAELWAVTRCYLTLLANAPDTHVARRHGPACADEVSLRAAALLRDWPAGRPAAGLWPALRDCDRDWKARRINPGTTADLVVASLLVVRLARLDGYNGGRPGAGRRDFARATG